METIQNSQKTKSEICWIESPKRKRYEFDTNFLELNKTTEELLPLWHRLNVFGIEIFFHIKIQANLQFVPIFSYHFFAEGEKVPYISKNFMGKFLIFIYFVPFCTNVYPAFFKNS